MKNLDKHSEKGIKTIELMNTKPSDWHLTPIRWEYVTLTVPTKVKCPSCHGYRRTSVNKKTGKPAKREKGKFYGYNEDKKWREANPYSSCPTCISAKTKEPTGEVVKNQKQKVLCGFPVWAKETKFDSRFEDGLYTRNGLTAGGRWVKCVCALCSKSITSPWAYRVPVQAKGKDGVIHGMYVGADCAKKILGQEIVLTADQKKELKNSVYKHFKIMEGA